MTQIEIVNKCKENGLNYSYMQIYRIGIKMGFIEKCKPRNIFHEDKFNEWLGTPEIPDDCISISEAIKKYNIPYHVFKYHFKKNNVEIQKGGLKNGGLKYARKSDIENVVKIYNENMLKRRSKNNG